MHPPNPIATLRTQRNWTQADLARRAGLPRTTISAIELNRLEPGVRAALALAAALGVRVEDLFQPKKQPPQPRWSAPPAPADPRFWQAEINGALINIPCEAGFGEQPIHDGVLAAGTAKSAAPSRGESDPARTLVIAGCDPALGFLPSLLRPSGIRLIVLQRSTSAALELLRQGFVHAAGVHWGSGAKSNAAMVKKQLGKGWSLLRSESWEEGLALAPGVRSRTTQAALAAHLRWVGREPGSGARHCAEGLLAQAGAPTHFKHIARDHRGVAEAIRAGWAQAGICIRLAAAQAGLNFLPLMQENVDLCFARKHTTDPRLAALANIYQSRAWRQALGDLPGYSTAHTGDLAHV